MVNIFPLQTVIVVFFAFLIWVDQRPYLPTEHTCQMSFMYGKPGYYQIPLDHTIRMQFKDYSLYLYTEKGRDTLENLGIPVLFIPGSSGSHEQVRSIATHTMYLAGQTKSPKGQKIRFTFFSVDLQEEISALHGGYLWTQTQFVVECVKFLKNKFYQNTIHNKVIIIGHSMGGIIARGMLMMSDVTNKDIPLIITLATPHLAPPLLFDSLMEAYYSQMQDKWLSPSTAKPIIISIGGGYSDVQVSSDLIQLEGEYEKSFSMVTTEIPRVWTIADHRCIVWCKELQVLIAKSLVNSISNSTGKLKNSQTVMRIFEEEIKFGFKTPKLLTNTIKCQHELDSYDRTFRIESGNTCLSTKVVGTHNDVILISLSLNTTLISCPDHNMNNCSLISAEHVELLPIAQQNTKVFRITPIEQDQYIINVNTFTQITIIRNMKSSSHRYFLPTPFPMGTHSKQININTHNSHTTVELVATWPMHIAYRVVILVGKCNAGKLSVVETSDGISDKKVHTKQPIDFYIRPEKIGFVPGKFQLELWQLEDNCEFSIEITASWWVTLFNFITLHLHLITHWSLLAILIQASLDVLSELEEQLVMLVVCIFIMFFEYGIESLVILMFHFTVFSIFGITAKLLQLANLSLIRLGARFTNRFPIILLTTLFLILGILAYFCSSLGLIILFILTHLSYIGNKLKNQTLVSWSLVLLLWLIGLTIPSLIAWLREIETTGFTRLHSDTFLLHIIVCSVGVLMRCISGEEPLIPDLHIPYGVVNLGLIVLYSYTMYIVSQPNMMYAMMVSVVFAILQAL
ncbi:GPI inositol-deacylase-like [Oopsacas minuta]|uniref:GPI inositol-deacylase n=1 Tax=Oopsacas minuta TaxID=111878 RepID=A0AAV7KDZ6_9METZ|nr:GPI inositol-deacylase-like [Oopsacas minuta]